MSKDILKANELPAVQFYKESMDLMAHELNPVQLHCLFNMIYSMIYGDNSEESIMDLKGKIDFQEPLVKYIFRSVLKGVARAGRHYFETGARNSRNAQGGKGNSTEIAARYTERMRECLGPLVDDPSELQPIKLNK